MATKRSAAADPVATKKPKAALRILVLSGPNLDRLGRREPHIYGHDTLAQIYARLADHAAERGVEVDCRQSNHEGALVDWINAAKDDGFGGILLNAGALTHTSYALYDSLKGAELPAVEVHISNPDARETFRHVSCIAPAVKARVAGFGPQSYTVALDGLLGVLREAPRKPGRARTPSRASRRTA
ncbi:MAG TPA: type II 3-dehydroquinate dehydratase [Polyangiaceae bacterium]|jgi:3-dehydroquinate dehydratase-2|nr:type II 3-dehydroquinate dehydratase [Polyangiaceae bacterium]